MSDEQLILYDRYYNICKEMDYVWATMHKDILEAVLND